MEKAWAWSCILLAMTILASECGAQDTSCINQLAPCLNYLNLTSGRPSSDCCDPLTSVIKSNPKCLCNLISSNTASSSINVTQAMLLPSKCGVTVNSGICSVSSSPNNKTSTEPNSGSRFSFGDILLASMLPLIIQSFWA
ncbi:lipid transfer-like protein VAS [Cinnamomum micranthum f. kanehirae]|uniref:Lipid transfer-like protein VAS n=1 Tax=Cinnamomum micranthum f. kanehirae TaxID=337451 RepID=A0A3S3NW67_9MAGN|nr:lipid transfer-like protein VAS [Cinnamomum micranthum f. kanehirae]